MKDTIRAYMENEFLFEFGGDLTDDADLFKAGVIDSFGYVQLVRFLQDEFTIAFSDEEMLTNIMVSLDSIVAAVSAKRSSASAA